MADELEVTVEPESVHGLLIPHTECAAQALAMSLAYVDCRQTYIPLGKTYGGQPCHVIAPSCSRQISLPFSCQRVQYQDLKQITEIAEESNMSVGKDME